jgi:CHAD domain-containing protein
MRASGARIHLPVYPYRGARTPARESSRVETGELVREALSRSAERFAACAARLCERDAEDALDPDAVHDARVAVRRLRSDLRSFRAFLDAEWSDSLREQLQFAGDALGAARDADVLLARLGAHADRVPEADRGRLDEVLAPLRAERDAAYVRVRALLGDERYAALGHVVCTGSADPPLNAGAQADADDGAAAVMRDAWRSLCKAVRHAENAPTDAHLHRVRIKAKRVRYAAEALHAFLGAPARRLAHRVARLQDVLGEQHDAVVAAARLRRTTWDGALAFVAGELAALEHTDALRARERWARCWRRAKRRRFRARAA